MFTFTLGHLVESPNCLWVTNHLLHKQFKLAVMYFKIWTVDAYCFKRTRKTVDHIEIITTLLIRTNNRFIHYVHQLLSYTILYIVVKIKPFHSKSLGKGAKRTSYVHRLVKFSVSEFYRFSNICMALKLFILWPRFLTEGLSCLALTSRPGPNKTTRPQWWQSQNLSLVMVLFSPNMNNPIWFYFSLQPYEQN